MEVAINRRMDAPKNGWIREMERGTNEGMMAHEMADRGDENESIDGYLSTMLSTLQGYIAEVVVCFTGHNITIPTRNA